MSYSMSHFAIKPEHGDGCQNVLEEAVSVDARARIDSILELACGLSDIEKLLLFFKLPTVSREEEGQEGFSPSSKGRREHIGALAWVHSHLEEHPDTALPKVYLLIECFSSLNTNLCCRRDGYFLFFRVTIP